MFCGPNTPVFSYRHFLIMCSFVCFHLFPSPCVMESGESLHHWCSRLLCSVTVIPHPRASTVFVGSLPALFQEMSQNEAVFWHFVASEGLYVLLVPLWHVRYFSSSPFLLNYPVCPFVMLHRCAALWMSHRKAFCFDFLTNCMKTCSILWNKNMQLKQKHNT